MYFQRSNVRHSIFVPFFVCTIVGVLAAIMGVGGGFMMVPMMVYLLRMPAHVAVGTDLFQILFTCAGVTYMQATTNHTVDLVLALLLALGSTIGAQLGARATRFHARGPVTDHPGVARADRGREDGDRHAGHAVQPADSGLGSCRSFAARRGAADIFLEVHLWLM